MSEKKVVSRRLFIALEIMCIILIACLVGATSLYSLQINDKDNTIANLQNQVNNLNNTLNLVKSAIWIDRQNATAYPEGGYQFSASYCGYIKVDFICTMGGWIPPIPFTVRVTYATLGVAYDDNQTITTAGSAFFPILPCNNIVVSISPLPGSALAPYPAFDVLTITYYYQTHSLRLFRRSIVRFGLEQALLNVWK